MKTLAALSMLALPAFAQENPWGPGWEGFMRYPANPGVRRSAPPAARPETMPYVPARVGRSMSDFGYRSVGAAARSTPTGAPLYEVPLRSTPTYEVEPDYRSYGRSSYDAPDYLNAYRTYGRR